MTEETRRVMYIGSALISPLFPVLLLWTGSASVYFYIAAACSVVAGGGWLLADSTRKIGAPPASSP